jgi:hypothetical protein
MDLFICLKKNEQFLHVSRAVLTYRILVMKPFGSVPLIKGHIGILPFKEAFVIK